MIILTTMMMTIKVVRWGVLTMRWTTLITSKTKRDWREAEESLSHIWKINSFTLLEIKMDFSYWLDFIRIARVSHKHLWIFVLVSLSFQSVEKKNPKRYCQLKVFRVWFYIFIIGAEIQLFHFIAGDKVKFFAVAWKIKNNKNTFVHIIFWITIKGGKMSRKILLLVSVVK